MLALNNLVLQVLNSLTRLVLNMMEPLVQSSWMLVLNNLVLLGPSNLTKLVLNSWVLLVPLVLNSWGQLEPSSLTESCRQVEVRKPATECLAMSVCNAHPRWAPGCSGPQSLRR